jgi:type IV secretory pathway VirB2 component (pilin)
MATEIRMRDPKTGDEKPAYEGYSWTSLLFGAFPTLLRGDIALGLAVLLVIVVLGAGAFVAGYPTWLTTGIVGAIWGQFYNKIHFDRLRSAGYEVVTEPPKVQT